MKKTLINTLLLCLALMGPVAVVQAQQAFSLQQAIDYALQNQQRVKIAQNEAAISKAKVGEIRAIGLPQANVNMELTNNIVVPKLFVPATSFDPRASEDSTMQVKFGTQYASSANFTINQLLFDGSYLIGLKAATTYTQLSKKTLIQTEIEVAEQVAKAYYGVLVTQERLKLLDQNLIRLDTLLFQTKQMNKEGFAEQLDVDRLQVAFNNLKVDKQRTERLMKLSEDLLKFQMGLKQTEAMELTDKLQDVEVDLNKVNTENFDYGNRIEYSILETQRDLAMLDYRNIRSGYLPKLGGFFRYGYNFGNDQFNQISQFGERWAKGVSIGAQLQIPIFDGFDKHYKMQQAKLKLDNTKAGLNLMEQKIDLDLNQSSTNLTNNLAVLESQKQNLALAQDIARVAKIKYQEGVGSNLEVITAETDLREAQTNYYSALYDALISKVDLDKATGTLSGN